MEASSIDRAVAALIGARRDHRRIDALPDGSQPADEAEAYAIQAAHAEAMLDLMGGGTRVGYKAGCTNVTAQAQLGLSAPFRGMLLSPFVRTSPTEISCEAGFMRMIEAELAIRLGQDLPARDVPYDAETVRPAVAALMPAIEVVDSRYVDWTTIGALHLIADNGSTGYWVHGDEVTDFADVDFADHPVTVTRNGRPAETGNTSNVLGNPLNVLAWLANHLAAYSLPLRAGDLVTTGTTIAVNPAERGDRVAADFGPVGKVAVEFT
jgi:2-keto-4-pentenoate hydratase